MRATPDSLICSATDLSNFLSCRHRTALEMAVARGKRARPYFHDPLLQILYQRGLDHEKAYVDSLKAAGLNVVDLSAFKNHDRAVEASVDAMRSGADVIVQASLRLGQWAGYPDILRRVERPSALGGWSYEVADTKLARETRAGTILQLGLYSEMLGAAQGTAPEHFHVVTPNPEHPVQTYRVDEYAAYFRLVREQMQGTVVLDDGAVAAANYPEPVDHCDICPWSSECSRKRRQDDHLSLVAGISRLQRRELEAHEVPTLTALASTPLPLPFKPSRGAVETYVRVREQARLQFESRNEPRPKTELRPFEDGAGLRALPEPSPGDVFLDLEGDALAAEGGREYLFGLVTIAADGAPAYRGFWAFTEAEERQAFEAVVDLVMQAWQAHPGMHVYHYAPYEPAAFKRLMGRYATRQEAIDRLLRAHRFVDLYGVVHQALIVGVERYSIKNLEVLYDFTRAVPLPDANRALLAMEQALELHCPERVPAEVRNVVQGYNRDDCVSTRYLRDWLEGLRAKAEADGHSVPRPVPGDGDPSENVDDRTKRVEDLRARLVAGVPDAPDDRSPDQRARWLLAYLLDWHRREDKAGWWEYFRLCELPEDELFDEPRALAGMTHVARLGNAIGKTGKPTKSVIDRYAYPLQEMEIRRKDELKLQDGSKWAEVVAVDRGARTIDVEKGPSRANQHPTAVFAHKYISNEVLEDALFGMGQQAARDGGAGVADLPGAAQDLLLRRPPRLTSGPFAQPPGEKAVDFAVRIAGNLDDTCLAIQGPPGAGKTYTGGQMILALVNAGKKVGVVATGHKVIRNLLDAVVGALAQTPEPRPAVRLGHKMDKDDDNAGLPSGVRRFDSNEAAHAALTSGEVNVLGGTAWTWARPEFAQAVDVLFVDEAGQMSLADVLAASGAARSIVLLGDPQQLEQPKKGSHPEGVDASALQHILGDHKTIPADRGIFLPVTWRLAPRICNFTSELFYERRLLPKPGLEHQRLLSAGEFDGSGLWVVPVEHEGNRNSSPEEVAVVVDLVRRLTAPGVRWVDERGTEAQMTGAHIKVVAPYNAQVSRLSDTLAPLGVAVGTVDKFQGQEAPVVIYSMATSRPEDAPRGMEFLYSLNRLNVATSRARCAAILVASPRLFEPECRTPRQMKLANALCRYREMAAGQQTQTSR